MELWIRSQDGERLTKATDLRIYYASKENVYAIEDCDDLGYYKTKERALEVLDEINNKIKNQFIVKVNTLLKPSDAKKLKMNYNGDFIMNDPMVDIQPTTQNVVYYEMPKE